MSSAAAAIAGAASLGRLARSVMTEPGMRKSRSKTVRIAMPLFAALATFAAQSTATAQNVAPAATSPPAPLAAPSPPPPPTPARALAVAVGVPQFVDISPTWPSDVLDAISGCKTSMACPTVKELKANHADAYQWVKGWCNARTGILSPDADEKRVCAATGTDTDAALGVVSILTLAQVAATQNPPDCSGFNLTIPLYSIRYGSGDADVKGPIAAGLGGGYYWAPPRLCRPSFSFGPEVFGYSEGLDPSGLFQVGLAAGAQIIAYKYFQFGLDLGYDLYRRQPGTDAMGAATVEKTGLLSGTIHKSDFSALITFSVVGVPGSSASKTQ